MQSTPSEFHCHLPGWGAGGSCDGLTRKALRKPGLRERVALPAGRGLCYNHGALWKTGGFPSPAEAGKRSKRRPQRKNRRSIVRRVPLRSSRTSASWFAGVAAILCRVRTTTDGNPRPGSCGASGRRHREGRNGVQQDAGRAVAGEINRKGGSRRATEDCEQGC